MVVAVINIWEEYGATILFPIFIAAVYIILGILLLYGSRKHSVNEILKSVSIIFFTFSILIESGYYMCNKYIVEVSSVYTRVIFFINSVIFIIGVIISLIDERYYVNTFPVTICRIAAYIIGLSIILIIIEFVYIVFIILGSMVLITIAVWSAVDFSAFKKLLFWRNKT